MDCGRSRRGLHCSWLGRLASTNSSFPLRPLLCSLGLRPFAERGSTLWIALLAYIGLVSLCFHSNGLAFPLCPSPLVCALQTLAAFVDAAALGESNWSPCAFCWDWQIFCLCASVASSRSLWRCSVLQWSPNSSPQWNPLVSEIPASSCIWQTRRAWVTSPLALSAGEGFSSRTHR